MMSAAALSHEECAALTDAANQGTDEPLVELVERIIASRLAAAEARAEAAEQRAEQAEVMADSMQHFADVAEVCERKSNEWAARAEAAERKVAAVLALESVSPVYVERIGWVVRVAELRAALDTAADPECACVPYTIRTDYGTGIEHDIDRSSCPVHGAALDTATDPDTPTPTRWEVG